MYWNSLQFNEQLGHCKSHYQADNKWFAWGDWDGSVLAAWRLYRNANKNPLRMIVLGSAKIRKDPTLLSNFGVTSGSGINDPEEVKLVQELERQRTAARAAPGLRDAPKVLGLGSILNDQEWSPLLNDSFIMGGVHGNHEFFLAEDGVERYDQFHATRATFGGARPATPRDKWLGFLRAHPDMFWARRAGVPRILAREMIGLMTFGYRPQFHDRQLGFAPDGPNNASFMQYHRALNTSGLVNRNERLLMNTLSNFLFDRSDVFRGI